MKDEESTAETGEEKKPETVTGIETGSNLVDELGDLPEVTPGVMDEAEPFSGLVDTRGRGFDKDLHAVDDSGKPILTTKGKLKLLKGGRPKGSGTKKTPASVDSGIESRIGGVPTPEDKQKITNENQSRALGIYSANMLISMGRAIGGEEWEPRKDDAFDERENLEIAFGDYYVAKDMNDIPPGLALTMALGTYVLPRMFMPTTQKRTLSLWSKVKLGIFKKKLEREAEEKEEKPGERKPEEKADSSKG